MKKLLFVGLLFFLTAFFLPSCGTDTTFVLEQDGVVIKGSLKEGSKLSVSEAETMAKSAIRLTEKK